MMLVKPSRIRTETLQTRSGDKTTSEASLHTTRRQDNMQSNVLGKYPFEGVDSADGRSKFAHSIVLRPRG